MYENIKDYMYAKEVIKLAETFRLEKSICVEEIQPFCIATVNQLTANDVIISEPISSSGTSFLKPTSIYFKNNCYVLGHTLIGTVYNPGGHYFSEHGNFEGFSCLTLDGKLCVDAEISDKHVSTFILKCNHNQYSEKIDINCDWLTFCNNANK